MTRAELTALCNEVGRTMQIVGDASNGLRVRGSFPNFVVEGTLKRKGTLGLAIRLIPSSNHDIPVTVRLYNQNNALDDSQDVYLNGVRIGNYAGRDHPPEDDLFNGVAKKGENTLSRVTIVNNEDGNEFLITVTEKAGGLVIYDEETNLETPIKFTAGSYPFEVYLNKKDLGHFDGGGDGDGREFDVDGVPGLNTVSFTYSGGSVVPVGILIANRTSGELYFNAGSIDLSKPITFFIKE